MRLLVPLLVSALLGGCGGAERTPKAAPEPASAPAQVVRSDKEQILDAIIRDVLESDFLKDVRVDYGTPRDKQVALVSNAKYGVPWPEDYRPVLPEGYRVCRAAEGANGGQAEPRRLGVRIDRFDLGQKEAGLFREPIEITVMNAGGTENGARIGGCSVYYIPVRKEGSWVVESTRLQDP
jgi:hypothetical protein